MKISTLSYLILPAMLLMLACSSTGKPDRMKNSIIHSGDAKNSQPSAGSDSTAAQPQLDSLMKNFDLCKNINQAGINGITRFAYNTRYEYEGSNSIYIFDQKLNLKYYYYKMGAEGGYEENKFAEYVDNNIIRILSNKITPGEGGTGTFGYTQNGQIRYFNVSFDLNDKATIISDPVSEVPNVENNFTSHTDSILKNSDQFKLSEGTYTFYVKRKTVPSQYGPVEISEYYQVDSALFVTKFLKK